MIFTNKTRAGVLIFIGAAWFLTGIIVSEALYPGYKVTKMISDLGVGSTAPIFNSAIFGFGLLLLVTAYLLNTAGTNRWFLILLILTGLGAAGVGVFPETIIIPHTIGAITVFVCGGLCAITGYRVFSGPWSWLSLALGLIALGAAMLFVTKYYLGLGAGGMERMIAYPLIIWALGTGAFLMAPESG
ncbi:MAG: hypothetical protein CVV30_01055 [Methanomicrobiales archaeon HGW-Methanomicrobiales-1]|jgi:hypothetical membrane protein|nr:MAG: hypothetical protein CVV30_01055 [Methanomicrobiales archaeon HGW-Methanomicrobiales-1]